MNAVREHVSLRAPYDFSSSIRYWSMSTAELTEQWADGVLRRLVPWRGATAVLTLRDAGSLDAPAVTAELDERPLEGPELAELTPLIRRILNDGLDLAAAEADLAGHALLGPLMERFRGLRPPCPLSLWEALVWAICAQQITLSFALTLKRRLVERYGEQRTVASRTLAAFPTPAALAAADPAELHQFQFARSKASYIIGMAQALEDGRLDLAQIEQLPTAQAIAELTKLRGVGPWTAEYALLRGIGRGDAVPASDAGLRKALVLAGVVPSGAPEPTIRSWAAEVAPWGGVATLYLWRSLSSGLPG